MTQFFRRVIHIGAEDSPNVRYAQREIELGLMPSGRVLVPGVIGWDELQKRLATWDAVRICIGIHGRFYKGAEVLLYPPAWLNDAERLSENLKGRKRFARAIGIDPAEGGDRTAMSAVDEYGLIELVSKRTPDTDVIPREALAFARKHGVPPHRIVFDAGGGGKQAADRLRGMGLDGVRTVAFGESVTLDLKRGLRMLEEKREFMEERYAYKNRRAQMYGELRLLLDPAGEPRELTEHTGGRNRIANKIQGFAIPAEYYELRRQMAPIPLLYDPEGRLRILPKNKRDKDSKEKTLTELIGHSPDELDSLVLAVYGMLHEAHQAVAGAV